MQLFICAIEKLDYLLDWSSAWASGTNHPSPVPHPPSQLEFLRTVRENFDAGLGDDAVVLDPHAELLSW
jgi:hypothetical protein